MRDGDRLGVKGPRHLSGLIDRVLAAKPQVLAALRAESETCSEEAGALLEKELGAPVVEELFAEIRQALEQAAEEETATRRFSDKELFGSGLPEGWTAADIE